MLTCEHCLARKITRKPFDKGTRANFPLQLIYSGICCPVNVKVRHRALYFITFIHTCDIVMFIWFLKSEVLKCFEWYVSLVENQLNMIIKVLRTDHGCKYLLAQFEVFCNEKDKIDS